MKGKIVVVTGASGGLGTFVTQAFLDAGATVVGVSRKIKQEEFASSNFVAMPAELSSLEAARQLAENVFARFGKIDVLAHLLGGFAGGNSVAETDDETWSRMLELNLSSAFHVLRAVLPQMRAKGSGRIFAIGSKAAIDLQPGVSAYTVSKTALIALIRTVALENKVLGITANVVLPGTMDTPANRKNMPNADFSKWVQPASVASLLVSLAGDAGAQVTGAVIPVFGQDV
jgi:NAD(P)-dependent dehydrogenase (short-subunit alcohol dehydrogenase family)